MTTYRFLARLLALSGATSLLLGPAARAELPMVELGAGMYRIEAELAYTMATRQVGLMNRRSMSPQRGMIFVFDEDARHCMWMKNTFIPLSVAFLDRDGRILNVAHMQPHSEDSHCAAGAARYALEMNQGWFAERGIDAGARIRGIERLPAAR